MGHNTLSFVDRKVDRADVIAQPDGAVANSRIFAVMGTADPGLGAGRPALHPGYPARPCHRPSG